MEQRLWVCPDCGVVKAYPDSDHHKEFPPSCDFHSEHWPDGEFSRTVAMKRTTTVVEVEE